MKGETVHLHDRYKLDVLLSSDSLDHAIKKNLVEVLQKEFYVQEPIEIGSSYEISNLKNEISELKNALNNNRVTIQTTETGLKKEDILGILQELKDGDKESTKSLLEEVVKNSLSNLSINSTGSIENSNDPKFEELSPDEVSAKYLTDKKKLSGGVGVKSEANIKETLDESVEDALSILEQLGDWHGRKIH